MELKTEVLRFLRNYPGLYTVNMIGEAIDRNPTTALRTAINLLVASGEVVKQSVVTDAQRLAWGYVYHEYAPTML